MELGEEIARGLTRIPWPVWTFGSLFLSIYCYSRKLGWEVAAAFLGLLAIHEAGHLLAAWKLRIKVSAPVFAPYLGAIIKVEDEKLSRWESALLGLSGPVLGTIGALMTYALYCRTGYAALAEGAFLALGVNFFNLLPLCEMDGGRAVAALNRWFWLPGLFLVGAIAWWAKSPVALLLCLISLPAIISLFRRKGEQTLETISLARRCLIALVYFSLLALIAASGLTILARDRHILLHTTGIKAKATPTSPS